MGAAMGVISQVAGVASGFVGGGGGGTVYQADPRAKYQADIIAYQSAVEGMKLKEEILKGQLQAQNAFNTYGYDLQNLTMQREMEKGYKDIYTQFQNALYQNGLERTKLEQDNYLKVQQYNTSTLQNEANRFAREQEIQLGKLGRKVGFQEDETQRALQASGLKMSDDMADFNEDMINAKSNLELERLKLKNQDLLYGQQQFDIALDTAAQDFRQLEDQIANQELQHLRDAQLQGVSAVTEREETKSAANVNEELSKTQSELQRGEALRELLRGVSRDERQFAQFEALLGAQGRRGGVQTAGVGFDTLNNEDVAAQRRSMFNRYGLEQASAGLEGSVARRRADTNYGIAERQIENELMSKQAQTRLARRQGRENLQEQIASITNQKNRAFDVGQGEIGIARHGIGLDRMGSLTNNLKEQGDVELQLAALKAQSLGDLFSKSLLPEVEEMGASMFNSYNHTLQQHMMNAQQSVQQSATQFQRDNLQRQGLIDTEAAKSAYTDLPLQWYLQSNSNLASYVANQGNVRMQEYAGLNQIGAETHGLLSQLGGYRSPPPQG